MDADTLKKMTVAQLREEARKIPGATGLSGMKKDELVAFVAEHATGAQAESAGNPAARKGKAPAKPGGAHDRPALKQRIRELKDEKKRALAGNDAQKARECNRAIHRCKHILRKLARQGV